MKEFLAPPVNTEGVLAEVRKRIVETTAMRPEHLRPRNREAEAWERLAEAMRRSLRSRGIRPVA